MKNALENDPLNASVVYFARFLSSVFHSRSPAGVFDERADG
jgi:hypothetical protein